MNFGQVGCLTGNRNGPDSDGFCAGRASSVLHLFGVFMFKQELLIFPWISGGCL